VRLKPITAGSGVLAIRSGSLDICKLVSKRYYRKWGVNPFGEGDIYQAALHGHRHILWWMLEGGASFGVMGIHHAMGGACAGRHIPLIKELLRRYDGHANMKHANYIVESGYDSGVIECILSSEYFIRWINDDYNFTFRCVRGDVQFITVVIGHVNTGTLKFALNQSNTPYVGISDLIEQTLRDRGEIV
jgi:hypothetical protein